MAPFRLALVLVPFGMLLTGCSLEPESAWVDVHNHTDGTVAARDADWETFTDCEHHNAGKTVIVPAHAVRTLWINVNFYDGDVEIEGEAGRHVYDLDFWPYEYHEVLHVRDDNFAPSGNG